MGNYASCALRSGAGKHGGGVKVLFPGGEIRNFYEPVKAAELMLETPNYFTVNSRSLQIGRRFAALSADEDLAIGELYVMFPMQKLGSVVGAADVGSLFMAAKTKGRRAAKVRVSPEAAQTGVTDAAVARLDLEELCSPEMKHRRSTCRSRKPELETILEEPVRSR